MLTLFPEVYDVLRSSIIGKALEKGKLTLNVINIRDYSQDKHKKCDDYPFGGGAGMLMTPQPIHSAIQARDPLHECLRIYLSPKGEKFCQPIAKALSLHSDILLLCGSYEGIDQRVIDMDIDMELSIGDYVLTSGDLPAMVVINAVARYVDGVLGSEQSTEDESFSDNKLEYPQYTRPQEFMGLAVPDVLVSGNHQAVDKWREEQKLQLTQTRRKDLLK